MPERPAAAVETIAFDNHHAQAHAEIQGRIITGEIDAYALLSENDLARRIGCGRTPVREALQRLKFEGHCQVADAEAAG